MVTQKNCESKSNKQNSSDGVNKMSKCLKNLQNNSIIMIKITEFGDEIL